MPIQATFNALSGNFNELREAVARLRLTAVEDRPPHNQVLLVERLGDAIDDVLGLVEEGTAAAVAALSAVDPLDGHRVRQALARANDCFLRVEYKLLFEIMCAEQIEKLTGFGRQRGGEWLVWTGSVIQALEHCRDPLREADEALLLAWQELSERLGAGSVSLQIINIGQQTSPVALEGHVEAKWKPRSYAVSSDLSGGISGAQATIYTMAKTILDIALPLIDRLYPMDPDPMDPAADAEKVTTLKQLASSQLGQLVDELGALGGPKVARVNQYFQMLLGITIATTTMPPKIDVPVPAPQSPRIDPEHVLGTLGDIRDVLGLAEISRKGHPSYANTVDDEQNVTNFRILVEYVNALLAAWQNSFRFFAAVP